MKLKQKPITALPILMSLTIASLIATALFLPLCFFFVLFSLLIIRAVVGQLGVVKSRVLLVFWAILYTSVIMVGLAAFEDSYAVGLVMVFGGYMLFLAFYCACTVQLYLYYKIALQIKKPKYTKTVLDKYFTPIVVLVFIVIIFSLYILPIAFTSNTESRKASIMRQINAQAVTLEKTFSGSSLATKVGRVEGKWLTSDTPYVEFEKYVQVPFTDIENEVHVTLSNAGFAADVSNGVVYGEIDSYIHFSGVEVQYSSGTEKIIVKYQFENPQSCSESTICNLRKKNEKGNNMIPLSNFNGETVDKVTVLLAKVYSEE